jgi:hypothetical protein
MPTIYLVNVTQTNLKVVNNIKENIVRNIENLCLYDVFKLFQSLRVVRIDSLEQLEDIIQRFSIFLRMFSVMLFSTFKFVCVTFTRKMVGISNTSYHNLPLFFFYFQKIHVKIWSSFFVINFYF